jgi:hypothetical protein
MGKFPLFTSISPALGRLIKGSEVGREYQRRCIESWTAAGFHVVSINSKSEVDAVRALGLPMEVRGSSDGRPRIDDILRAAVEARSELCAIVNGDCRFIEYGDIADKIASFSERMLLVAERVDIETDANSPIPGNCAGFDAFFFNSNSLARIRETNFRIGDPWWDYWFPCELASQGLGVHRLATPLVLHLAHTPGWKRQDWVDNGKYFREQLTRQLAAPERSDEFSRAFSEIDVATIALIELAQFVHGWLRSQDDNLDVELLPLTNPTSEHLLRSLRDYHSVKSIEIINKQNTIISDLQFFKKTVGNTLEVVDNVVDNLDNGLNLSNSEIMLSMLGWPIKIIQSKPFHTILYCFMFLAILALNVFLSIIMKIPGFFWVAFVLLVGATSVAVGVSYVKGKMWTLRQQTRILREQTRILREQLREDPL